MWVLRHVWLVQVFDLVKYSWVNHRHQAWWFGSLEGLSHSQWLHPTLAIVVVDIAAVVDLELAPIASLVFLDGRVSNPFVPSPSQLPSPYPRRDISFHLLS
jgi:hypothetical protein